MCCGVINFASDVARARARCNVCVCVTFWRGRTFQQDSKKRLTGAQRLSNLDGPILLMMSCFRVSAISVNPALTHMLLAD